MCRSSFSEFAQRHSRDERFKVVEKMREREQLFSEYLQELKKTAATTTTTAAGRGRQRGGDRSAANHNTSSADKVCSQYVLLHMLFDWKCNSTAVWQFQLLW